MDEDLRAIVFDTETTGLDKSEDRIIEIGAIEIINHFPTGRVFHHYINPQGRAVHPDALAVHGIGEDKLQGKPTFPELADAFLQFIDGAQLIAHNATFDMGFINAELARLGRPAVDGDRVIDTLQLARRKHPMGPNSLDALCRRYGIDNARRTKHGALLDSELLAEVYVELIGGKQTALVLESFSAPADVEEVVVEEVAQPARARPHPLSSRLDADALAAHARLISGLGEKAIWAKLSASSDAA